MNWEECNDPQIASRIRARHAPDLRRRHRRRRSRRRHRALQHRARAGRSAQSGRAAAAFRRAGRHRPGLPARRRYHVRYPEGSRSAEVADHERRHRVRSADRARAGRKADQRGRAAPGRRIRFRPVDHDRSSGRAARHSVRHQHRRRPADHRAGLQVRVPQFPDRAGTILGDAFGNQKEMFAATGKAPKIGCVHARQRHLRHRDAEGHRRRDAEIQHALQDRRDDRLRSESARSLGRGREGEGHRRGGVARGQPPERRDPAHPRAGQAALDRHGRAQHGPGLVRGPVSQDARQSRPTVRSASCPGTTRTRRWRSN